jgi:thiamine-phosphate pyrophosphorylase
MAVGPLLYYITDRRAFAADEPARRRALLEKIGEAARAGVDYIQLREKDLPTRELEALARDAMAAIREAQTSVEVREPRTESRELGTEDRELATQNWGVKTAFLINSRTDIALATGADGVHLPCDDVSPEQVRGIWAASPHGAGVAARVKVSVACHKPEEVHQASIAGADVALFAPIFEKRDAPDAKAAGLDVLRHACQYGIPVLALGGITLDRVDACLEAGAAGIAAIRLFQENDVLGVVRRIRG